MASLSVGTIHSGSPVLGNHQDTIKSTEKASIWGRCVRVVISGLITIGGIATACLTGGALAIAGAVVALAGVAVTGYFVYKALNVRAISPTFNATSVSPAPGNVSSDKQDSAGVIPVEQAPGRLDIRGFVPGPEIVDGSGPVHIKCQPHPLPPTNPDTSQSDDKVETQPVTAVTMPGEERLEERLNTLLASFANESGKAHAGALINLGNGGNLSDSASSATSVNPASGNVSFAKQDSGRVTSVEQAPERLNIWDSEPEPEAVDSPVHNQDRRKPPYLFRTSQHDMVENKNVTTQPFTKVKMTNGKCVELLNTLPASVAEKLEIPHIDEFPKRKTKSKLSVSAAGR